MAANGSKKESVAIALASGLSVRKTACQCKIGARTIHRWLEDRRFQQKVSAFRSDMFDRAVGRLSRISGKAATVLNRLLDSKDERIRLSAAKTVLESGMKAREFFELSERIDALEKLTAESRA